MQITIYISHILRKKNVLLNFIVKLMLYSRLYGINIYYSLTRPNSKPRKVSKFTQQGRMFFYGDNDNFDQF